MKRIEGETLESVLRRMALRERSQVRPEDLSVRASLLGRLPWGRKTRPFRAEAVPGEDEWIPESAALLGVFMKLCEAVAFAHSKGVIHRDLKPANVMLGRYGEVLLLDWGLAKRAGRSEDVARGTGSGAELDDSPLVTLEGTVVGTPSYMAPEQAAGRTREIGVPADVFALGSVLYHMVRSCWPRPPIRPTST